MRNKSQLRKKIQEREAKRREELYKANPGMTLEELLLKKRRVGTSYGTKYEEAENKLIEEYGQNFKLHQDEKQKAADRYEKSLKTQDQDWKPEHKKG